MPLWIISYFNQLVYATERKRVWACAHMWFEEIVQTSLAAVLNEFLDTITDLCNLFARLGWDVMLGCNLWSTDILHLFNTDMVKDKIINTAVELMNKVLPTGSTTKTMSTDAQWAIEQPKEEWVHYHTANQFAYLQDLGTQLSSRQLTELGLPHNVEGFHWAGTSVDVVWKEIGFSNSMLMPRPPKLVDQITHWMLQHSIHGPFTEVTIPTPLQHDGLLCSIVWWITFEHCYHSRCLWTQDCKHLL